MKTKGSQSAYALEKKRAQARQRLAHEALMSDAKAAFDELIERGRAARHAGRPKGSGTRTKKT